MSSLSMLHTQPKIIVRQGRIIRKINMRQTEKQEAPSIAEPRKEVYAKWYQKNKEKVLAERREYRKANREALIIKSRERRAQERVAREHAAVLRDSSGVRGV